MKDLKINCPDGYVIDQDKSNLSEGIIYFKEVEKVLNYEGVAKALFIDKTTFYMDNCGDISFLSYMKEHSSYPNNAATREQLKSILALNKLCNVAKYLNDGWLPKWGIDQENYCINIHENKTKINGWTSRNFGLVYFKSKELAEQAIKILGEEEIKKALTLNH